MILSYVRTAKPVPTLAEPAPEHFQKEIDRLFWFEHAKDIDART